MSTGVLRQDDRERFLQRIKETTDYCCRIGQSDRQDEDTLRSIHHREFDIRLRTTTAIRDEELDVKVKQEIGDNRLIGPNSIRVRLAEKNIFVTRQRFRHSCLRVDPPLRSLERKNVERMTYQVAGPNSLWNLDGNRKLIRYMRMHVIF